MKIDQNKLNKILNTAIADLSAGYGGVMMSLGDKLGLYKSMAGAGPLTTAEIAKRTGCAVRYVQEWLNSQVAGGYLDYHAASQTYELTSEHAMVLADDTSPVFIPHAWDVPLSMWLDEEKSIEAFRKGNGVSWGNHHHRLYCGVAAYYRNAYRGSLVQEWLPSLNGIIDKLTMGGNVADVGCGHGHSTVIMANAFPNSIFYGYDPHEDSICAAREIAENAGLGNRVVFDVATATNYPKNQYDLICFFDCLHDMGRPVEALRYARETLNKNGIILLVEPFAHDRLEDNVGPIGRLFYSASTTLCCAHAISENGTHVLGAQAGRKRLELLCQQAGLSQFRVAKETPFNMIIEAKI